MIKYTYVIKDMEKCITREKNYLNQEKYANCKSIKISMRNYYDKLLFL